jgi:hypothetical protein
MNEDSLYEMVSSAISKDSHCCLFLDYVGYEYLSKSSMLSFFDFISHLFHFLTISIWNRLRSRLIDGIYTCESPRIAEQHGPCRDGSPFEGIISLCFPDITAVGTYESRIFPVDGKTHVSRAAKKVHDMVSPYPFAPKFAQCTDRHPQFIMK